MLINRKMGFTQSHGACARLFSPVAVCDIKIDDVQFSPFVDSLLCTCRSKPLTSIDRCAAVAWYRSVCDCVATGNTRWTDRNEWIFQSQSQIPISVFRRVFRAHCAHVFIDRRQQIIIMHGRTHALAHTPKTGESFQILTQ